jgi:hypothetical protein
MKASSKLEGLNINFNTEVMDNGEQRFRLVSGDSSTYIRTIAGEHGAWQNSHYHKALKEIYIVQNAWIAVAELINNKMQLRIERENCIFVSRPSIPHNIYLPTGAVIHTVKYGNAEASDWHSSKDLDELTINLSEKQIIYIDEKA